MFRERLPDHQNKKTGLPPSRQPGYLFGPVAFRRRLTAVLAFYWDSILRTLRGKSQYEIILYRVIYTILYSL
jgi:hypothetical protein